MFVNINESIINLENCVSFYKEDDYIDFFYVDGTSQKMKAPGAFEKILKGIEDGDTIVTI